MSKKTEYIKDYSYPNPEDSELLAKIFKKREFYYHRVPERNILKTYDEIQAYRNNNCKKDEKEPKEHQAILPNYINPDTPYKGVILMHGVGSGKTMTAIKIAEKFKEQAKKYGTKIYVVVPGPNTRENFKGELLYSTGETYLKNKEAFNQMTRAEIEREKKLALNNALQYYKILSYKTFYRKVLGEKIIDKKLVGNNKIKSTYRKTTEGDYERELVIDRIVNMNNTLLIIDEAHNISDNQYGEALKKIIKESENLKVILLTATPMINFADEIIHLLNFLRPKHDQIYRDKVFTSEKNYLMKIKPGGLEYLKEKARGYISFYRGSVPYTFAKRIDKGVIPPELLFTPVIECKMEPFQYETYKKTIKHYQDLDKDASASANIIFLAAANFVYPGLDKEKKNIIGYYSTEGMNTVLAQLNTDGDKLRKLINEKIFKNKFKPEEESNLIYENRNKQISGTILQMPYIKHFSSKFYIMIEKLNKLVDGKKGPSTAFVYSNLVNAGGIELFAEALNKNGYLEYQQDPLNYNIKDDTLDYKTGLTYAEFKKVKNINDFKPATYILITGSDEYGEELPEVKQKIISDVFNNPNNIDGKFIKFILGSKVMNEGITLKNCRSVHIMDIFFNLPKVEQAIGRVIRMCVHQDLITDNYKFPEVNVYRYIVGYEGAKPEELLIGKSLYKKAEQKYLTIKQVERALKEVAIDCPLLLHANMFPEELDEFKNCVPPTAENIKEKKKICPALCDFQSCDIKCDSNKLNEKYWEAKHNSYKKLSKDQLDYNTFNDELAKYEISLIKNKIKDLYRFRHVYIYNEILNEIKKSFLKHQAELFEEYFLDQALEDMMPKTENDFNNYTDTIYDKYNRPGYLIQRNKYFIFQPFNQNEDVPMYYRQQLELEQNNQVSLNNYIKQKFSNIIYQETPETNLEEKIKVTDGYNFDETLEYYESREENFIVGIIDKNINKLASTEIDLFKIRPPKSRVLEKKRGTGIPTFKGAVCSTAKDKKYLMKLIKMIPNITKTEIANVDNLTREEICTVLKDKLLYLEKYATTKDKNKITYIMIPFNHPYYPFPYNLEDRIKYRIKQINKLVGTKIEVSTVKQKNKNGDPIYEVSFQNEKYLSNYYKDIENLGFTLKNKLWTTIIE